MSVPGIGWDVSSCLPVCSGERSDRKIGKLKRKGPRWGQEEGGARRERKGTVAKALDGAQASLDTLQGSFLEMSIFLP